MRKLINRFPLSTLSIIGISLVIGVCALIDNIGGMTLSLIIYTGMVVTVSFFHRDLSFVSGHAIVSGTLNASGHGVVCFPSWVFWTVTIL